MQSNKQKAKHFREGFGEQVMASLKKNLTNGKKEKAQKK